MKLKYLITVLIASLTAFTAMQAVEIEFNRKIAVRDGIELSANIYKPDGMKEARPVILILTPYSKDRSHKDAKYFTENGYVTVLLSCRGRDNSGGIFVPFEHDGKDGADAIKWIDSQKWCDGRVGMVGASYLGMVQWLIMKENPPALKSAIPIASVCPGIDFPMINNIFYSYNAQWLAFVEGNSLQTNAFIDHEYWNAIFRKMHIEHEPYFNLPELSGISKTNFNNWLKHSQFDEYYKNILLSEQDYANINIPILTVTGFFDDDQAGNLYYYNNFMKYGDKDVKDQCRLIIGPWDHGGTRRPKAKFEDMEFGDNAVIDMNEMIIAWFDHTIKMAPLPEFLENNVRVYIPGKNEWQGANSLEKLSSRKINYYLSAEGRNPFDVSNSGIMNLTPSKDKGASEFVYNPMDTTFVSKRFQPKLINYNWREENEAYIGDKLIFHTAPFDEDVVIMGQFEFEANIEMNVPDTDFEGIVYEITPDGKVNYLSSGIIRGGFRNRLDSIELVKPGEIFRLNMNTFHYTAREIRKGSRLRFLFGCLDNPYFRRSYNSGFSMSSDNPRNAKTAVIKLYHDNKRKSRLIVPLGD